jgi:hypothetical protein
MKPALVILLAACVSPMGAALLDRIAVTVDNDVITASEVDEEIRVTAFENGTRPDFSPATRRQAAERLVDQDLIRKELDISRYPQPAAADVQKTLDQLKRTRFQGDDAAYRRALSQYDLTGEEVRAHVAWQLGVVRFNVYRFEAASGGKADAAVDRELEAWLKQSRSQSRIRYHEEAFQ